MSTTTTVVIALVVVVVVFAGLGGLAYLYYREQQKQRVSPGQQVIYNRIDAERVQEEVDYQDRLSSQAAIDNFNQRSKEEDQIRKRWKREIEREQRVTRERQELRERTKETEDRHPSTYFK